jgi:hypothetical protein
MSGVSREQIARAKEIGIDDYILSREPDNVKRVGNAYYLKDHDSLEISKPRRSAFDTRACPAAKPPRALRFRQRPEQHCYQLTIPILPFLLT